MQNNTMKPGDIYCGQETKTGKYFVYQLIDIMENDITYLLLDYFNEKLPDEKDIPSMKPFKRERWFFEKGSDDYCHSGSGTLPAKAIYIGNRKPMISGDCLTYGCWPNGSENLHEDKWAQIPADARIKFKTGLADKAKIVIAGNEYWRSLQYISDNLLSTLDDYSELEKLPAAYSFTITKPYPELIPFLETRWTASKLNWKGHGMSEIDLSRTHLREIVLNCDGLKIIKLPASCEELTLSGKLSPDLKISEPDEGSEIILIIPLNEGLIPPFGLTKLKKLQLTEVVKFDLSPIAELFPLLHELRIWGKPGYITNLHAISNLKELNWISLHDVFGFAGEEFPAPGTWQHLDTIWLTSVPEEAGKHIKKMYKGKIEGLDVRKLRKSKWLAENLDNPLRHWDGSDFVPQSKFKKAVTIYRDTRREILALANQYVVNKDNITLQKQFEEIAKKYVIAFNKLESKSWVIETEEREDICMAFEAILDAADGITKESGYEMDRKQIYEVMDENREW